MQLNTHFFFQPMRPWCFSLSLFFFFVARWMERSRPLTMGHAKWFNTNSTVRLANVKKVSPEPRKPQLLSLFLSSVQSLFLLFLPFAIK
ncbi:hypothetical protein DM01DRAFT_1167122 [Hesseltinella vesiculosa]|uniref:Uncharacterized protein n=1 Tax=Hesseltinella vesiculosa TaxID=101127 RepID=A0A1X2G5W9_9FUNG|nr:hypothetical protein DM01DRAFT_1167122 [Hesseltinella vesiculosa]